MATILVVEDDPQVQGLVRLTLTRAGHEVVQALSGEQALGIASGTQIDLAVIDNRLPGISGLETFRGLRQFDPLLPGIVLTGYASVPNAVEAMRAGIVDYLPKPFTPRELTKAVERGLRKAKGPMPGEIPVGSPTTSPADTDPWVEKARRPSGL